MDYEKLFRQEKPAFYIQVTDESSFADMYLQLKEHCGEAAIRIVRGNKSTNVPNFFNEVGAALQFPYYFGENWDAFEECITDLSWLDSEAYLLMVSQANLLLQDAAQKDFHILMQILLNAHDTWLNQPHYVNEEEEPTAFHVLFACNDLDVSDFSQRLVEAGVEFQVL
ncbi:MAG: barstar family protein [Scytonema hyalinum WJT4-NPBG1]|jgi:RNAse (barnase) inhibitor barstar|nr:barstar family protein [Scytonema hyalinum WJT4-NPBG1]